MTGLSSFTFLIALSILCFAVAIIFSLGYLRKRHRRTRKEEKRQPVPRLSFAELKELMVTKRETEEEIELDRKEAYIERPTQKLLRNLLDGGNAAEIVPTYDPSFGFRYPTVESVFSASPQPGEAEALLERLATLEILKKRFYDTVSACPICGSTTSTIHFSCPKCASHHVIKTGLTEHIPCGNIDEREKYNRGHLLPVCPKCNTALIEGEYRDMGLWYICGECGEKFEHPNLDLLCRKCDKPFSVQTTIVREISKYYLNPEKEQEIRRNVASLESINRSLIELGFSVEMSASATGERSGIQHNFSLIAKKITGEHENTVVIDHAVEDREVGASPLILFIYKISEVKVDLPIFIAIPKLSETGKRIAQGYNILIVEGIPEEKEQLLALHKEIEKRLSERIDEAIELKPSLEIDAIHQWIIRRGKKVDVWRDHSGKFLSKSELKKQASKQD